VPGNCKAIPIVPWLRCSGHSQVQRWSVGEAVFLAPIPQTVGMFDVLDRRAKWRNSHSSHWQSQPQKSFDLPSKSSYWLASCAV